MSTIAVPERGRRVRRPSGDDRERDILATAERLLGQRGVADISVDDLARGAGISRPTFYFYFSSKEAVVLALLDRVAEEARLARGRALEAAGDVPEIWRFGVGTILNTFISHRPVMLAVAQLAPGSEEVRQLWARILGGFVDDTALAVESELARGRGLAGIEPQPLAMALVWMTERTFLASVAGLGPHLPPDQALEVVLRIWSRAIYGDDSLGA